MDFLLFIIYLGSMAYVQNVQTQTQTSPNCLIVQRHNFGFGCT